MTATMVLALATMGVATEIGSFLLAKVSKKGVIMPAISHRAKYCQCKYGLTDNVLALATLGGTTQIGSFLFQSLGQGK